MATENMDVTLVLDPGTGNPADGGENTGACADFSCDVSLEFRRSLERVGRRYRILRQLAEGGFGRIFLAEDLVLGRHVAVKSLKDEHLKRPESLTRFVAEARLNARLDHPSIVQPLSLDSDSLDGLHLAMQLVDGITLKAFLKNCREEISQKKRHVREYEHDLRIRLESFLKACDAVEYSHSRGIIHCDLKPENIMLGQHGAVFVMDWGIACSSGTDRKGRLNGTPAYMAPESFSGAAVSPQTDVFALGMILNEVVTLRPPVSGSDSSEVVSKIRKGAFEPSSAAFPGIRISPALRAIIEKARAADAGKRYGSVKEFADDVRRYLFDEEVSAFPDRGMRKFMRFLHHHRYGALLTFSALICVSSGLAIFGLLRHQRLASQVTVEMMRRLKVQQVTEGLGRQIDSLLIRTQAQLNGLATSQLIERNTPATGGDGSRFYLNSEFAPDSSRKPEGLIKTPFYGNEVSFEHASYFKPAGMPRSELAPLVKQLRGSRKQALSLIWDSMEISEDNPDLSSAAILRYFPANGALLRRITYLMENGVALRYPGMYEKVSSPERFLGPLRKEHFRSGARTAVWSSPYADSSGHAVVACWLPLPAVGGRSSGLVGFELCCHKLIKPLMDRAVAENFQTTCYLLDSENDLIFSSDDEVFRESRDHVCRNWNVLKKPFPYPRWLERLRTGLYPQFVTRLRDGRLVRVSMVKLPHAGWTLIRVVPPGVTDRIDPDVDRRMRGNVENDILLEKELFAW